MTEFQSLSADERAARLTELRAAISRSIERGGSCTDEEVEASISARLDDWERQRAQT